MGIFPLAALDIAANAAVATAAYVNGSPLTARVLQLGALAGITKSGILAFVEIVGYARLPTPAWILLVLISSAFGICVLITAEICSLVQGESGFKSSSNVG
jgi:amino acid transporter